MSNDTAGNWSRQGHSASPPKPTTAKVPDSSPPPPYDNGGPYRSGAYPNVQPYPASEEVYSVYNYQEPTWLRFLRAMFVAVMIWVLFSFFIQSIVYLTRWSHAHGGPVPKPGYPIPHDLSVRECTDWNDNQYFESTALTPDLGSRYPFASSVSYSLPLDSEVLMLTARGPLSSSWLNISTSPEQERGAATVNVTVTYYEEAYRDAVLVCLVSRKEGENGVGIFTPDWLRHRFGWSRMFSLKINMVLPEVDKNEDPISIKRLETALQSTNHHVESLADKVRFSQFYVDSHNALVTVKSLLANEGVIKTSNSHIRGTFNSTEKVVLKTSNGEIDVAVGLNYTGATRPVPIFEASTSNARLEAKVGLFVDDKDKFQSHRTQPSYRVKTRTSNSQMKVDFTNSPTDSILDYEAKDSNGGVSVGLHPAYEGSYWLKTSNSGVEVQQSEVEDPSGRGRTRRVSRESEKWGVVSGVIEWVSSRMRALDKGSVEVETSNGQIVLLV